MNTNTTMLGYSQLYKKELIENIVPFWTEHSIDKEFGGYYTCLDREGKVFDTDKFAWLQGRQVWTYAMLNNRVEQNEDWVNIAKHGANFLLKNGRDNEGNFYFSFNRAGQPLVQPYNIFSDCFAAMGLGALYKADPVDEYGEVAYNTFQNILKRRNNPKGKYSKIYPGTRDLKNFALPMILCNLSLELEHLLDKQLIDDLAAEVIHEVMETFYDAGSGLILENVHADGSFSDSFEGRVLNPGHAIEAMWFIMDLGVRLNNKALIEKAITIALRTLKFGWDDEHAGIIYFKDIKGHPVQQLEWDQKLWWVHIEALVCMAKAYQLTGNQDCADWFIKLHEYTWPHFRDNQYGEWFGYLNRRGEVLLPLKGGKWKGCFHIPRGLYQVWKTLEVDKLAFV
ncbi:AGE family epimerase/isomerase [Mucilaginibacter paludis]|uniref:N-acylglucosamine 2-epimerase n=1 Tax=Mucilaginibacter paludis DSM 18603 TaxID=714943 RepID=H1Y6M7_9SPHI|nr:AGE family epimerase/isomerase [Mucilaginibacter paludis]EHQ26819.1 N-acylglucosamine 2-epimerase [Mucilaginibacter paludis DSM 18603]